MHKSTRLNSAECEDNGDCYMRILLVGNHNPHFVNSVVYREKAIQQLGHEFVFFDDRKWLIPGRIRDKIRLLHKWDLDRLNNNLLSLIENSRPDICLFIGGFRTYPAVVNKINDMGIKTVLWTTDPPTNFDNVIAMARVCRFVFCSGTEAMNILQIEGISNTVWLPFACAPDYHRPVELTDKDRRKYARKIAFVGSYDANRARILESLSDLDIGVWGPYWNKLEPSSPLKPKAKGVKLNYDVWVKIFNAADIVVVIHFQDGKTINHQASPKLFEALACKSFVIVDSQKDAMTIFKDKYHVVFFSDTEDLRKKVLYYLEHPEKREIISSNGYNEALAHHTYIHRIEKMLKIISSTEGAL